MVQAIPAGHACVTAYLSIRNAIRALEFQQKTFGSIGAIATHTEDVAHEEMERRVAAMTASGG